AEDYDPDKGGLGTSFFGSDEKRKAIAEYADAHSKGWLSAWDPVAQREVWRGPVEKKGSGGVLVTAGNLVFQGSIGATFAAYRADTGEKVWEMPVQNVPIAAPITYLLDGVQYIAVNAGWGGGLAHVESANYADLHLGPPRLLVFKIGGNGMLAALAPRPPQDAAAPVPLVTAPPGVIPRGERLFALRCALCPGPA